MENEVNRRPYDSPLRRHQAQRTRRSVLRAARRHFDRDGYAARVSAIATSARVSVDTVYTTVGRKPELLLAVIDTVLGSSEDAIPAEQRDYVRALTSAPTAEEKLEIYAAALGRLMPQVAPLLAALAQASVTEPECARVWQHLKERRAANMHHLAEGLRSTGQLRDDLTDDDVADVVWVTNSLEYFTLLVERRWDADRYATHLADLWKRVLLG